jgi:hypothetical protein
MAAASGGTGGKTSSGEKTSQSRWHWLKKPVVWVATLITAIITGVLVNLATGAASHVTAAPGGAAPRIEVDSVTAGYLPASPQGLPRPAPVKIDFEIRNTGNQLAIIRGARFTVQQFTALPQCLSQGGLPETGLYKAFLPTKPAPGTTVDIPTAQQVGPDAADRFGVALGLPTRRPHGIYVYRVRIGLLIDNSRVPANAGEAVIALPAQPDPSYFWTKQDAAHPGNVPAFMGSAAIPELSQCLVANSHRLGSILAMAGAAGATDRNPPPVGVLLRLEAVHSTGAASVRPSSGTTSWHVARVRRNGGAGEDEMVRLDRLVRDRNRDLPASKLHPVLCSRKGPRL